jgi:ribosomal protein S18 acetylase RimI-like enzyme
MDRIIVRPAKAADVELLVPLFEGYRAFYKCDPNQKAARVFLEQRLDRGESSIFIAIDETNRVGAGFVQLYPVFSSLQMKPAWILNDLFVAPAYRGQHLSRRLMDAARDFAVSTRATTLTLETANDNTVARALYESLGYKREEHFVQYVLDVSYSTRQKA